LQHTFADLGASPLANSYLSAQQMQRPEAFFPLHVKVCHRCFLVQLPEVESPENIFSDYAYFSSYSDTWLDHARRFAAMTCERFALEAQSRVVEVASNDGYLLRFFAERKIPVLGIEPAANVAAAAEALGVPTRVEFFGSALARRLVAEGHSADLLVGNNVLAHTPYLNDFVAGLSLLLKPEGVLSLEFPHLLQLISENQFDTIYHEHFSYFSFTAVERVFARHGLTLFDVEELPTHGGSLRIYARHTVDESQPVLDSVLALRERERGWGVDDLSTYDAFAARVRETKRGLLDFLIRANREGKQVVGYGAPGKGNTLLNYCGIRSDLLAYTVDRNPYKQNTFTPGARVPIYDPSRISETRPDYVLILPWNLRDEIAEQMAFIREWGGQFVVPIPSVEVF
jgi:SAM-dependent methyltransferase